MEQPRYLIDTNAVIDYLGNKLPLSGMQFMDGVINSVPMVSVITKIEVLGFNKAGDHYGLLVDFMNDATVFDLTSNVVERCIEVRKFHKTKLPDVIIAATAMVNNLTLVSRNTSDFKSIPGLTTVDVYKV